jgi:hypothetical protein
MPSAIAVVLIGLGAAFRFVPHLPPNAVPIGALAIFAAARLPKLWAVLVPVLALVISDPAIVLGTKYADTLFAPSTLLRYAIVAGIALAVAYGPRKVSPLGRGAQAVGAALIFFLVSNFLVWAFPSGLPGELGVYPHTLAGLVECYAQGLPFFQNSLAAEVVGVGVLFGLDALARALAVRSKAGDHAIAS